VAESGNRFAIESAAREREHTAMRRRILVLAVATLLAGACSKPVLDPSNLDGSIAKLRDSLEMSRRIHFDEAIALVREASTGKIPGTKPFSLAGMTAGAVIAEAERIEIRRERALEVTAFVPQQVDPTRMAASVTLRNGLRFAIDSAWLRVEVGIPGGASSAGDEFLAFQPSLKPGEVRTVGITVAGAEARSLPVEPPAQAHYRVQLVESGGKVALEMPTPEMRQKAEADLAEVQRRVAELDTRLAAVQTPD
jgi:hypothetical protein